MSDLTLAELDEYNALIEQLRGTCDTLDNVLFREDKEHLQDHMPFLDYMDNHIFQCTQCSWWCEISEAEDSAYGELICNDCAESEG